MNVVKEITRFNAGREAERLAIKYERMRGSAFVFLRATCHLFHARLPDAAVLRKAPRAWACGDLHLENFGAAVGESGLASFDINDFDEALLGPATLDLVRLLASLHVGRTVIGVGHDRAALDALSDHLLDAWAAAIADGKARWLARENAPAPVAALIATVQQRAHAHLLAARTERHGRHRRLRIDGRRTLSASAMEHAQVSGFVGAFAARREDAQHFEVLDVARRVAGTGSLGLPRFLVLVRGLGGAEGGRLLDLKAAQPSSAAARLRLPQPPWSDEAGRVVTLQQRMQAVAPALLHALDLGGTPCVMRALQPSADRIDFSGAPHPHAALRALVGAMGRCLAWAQLRSSGRGGAATADELAEFAAGSKWRRRLGELAREAAVQVEADWRSYASAYDAGEFTLPK